MPGCYKQKALDIRGIPSLPRHIMLHRARGVEEMAVADKTSEVFDDSVAYDEPEDILKTLPTPAHTVHGTAQSQLVLNIMISDFLLD